MARRLKLVTHIAMRAAIILAALAAGVLSADEWTYLTEDGEQVVEARLVADGFDVFALEKADGSMELVPQANVRKRVPKADPTPLTPDEFAAQLVETYGADTCRTAVQPPFVVALVLGAPIDSAAETRVRAFLKKATAFMKRTDQVFKDFAREARIPVTPPVFPLGLLIFELDRDFEEYAADATGGGGLSSESILGFYSQLSNLLAVRLSECHTFATPLHEAIHLHVFNQGVQQRLAPLPAWFNEGIATGFEGNGDRIDVGPLRISSHFSRRALAQTAFPWKEVVENDRPFRGDVFAADAYTHAWSLHWLLVTRYADQYRKYVEIISRKKPLEEYTPEQRLEDFETAFKKVPDDLQSEFRTALQLGLKRQKVQPEAGPRTGVSSSTSNLAQVDLSARATGGGPVEADGTLKNISPIRAMTYHVTLETASGQYAEWVVPKVPLLKSVPLPRRAAVKRMQGAPGGFASGFSVRVRAVIPGSDDALKWERGQLPVPTFR